MVLDVPGQRFVTTPERVERRGPGRFTWFGPVEGGGRAVLTVEAGRVMGRIVTSEGLVMIEPDGVGHRAYRPLPPRTLADDVLDALPGVASPPALGGGPVDALFPDEFQIALFYTPAVAATLGDGLDVFIQAAEDVVNDVLANAGVEGHVRIVYRAETAYEESGSLMTDLERFTVVNDGYMDEVRHSLFRAGADAATLVVDRATDPAGSPTAT